jgi:hypothetical protein
MAQPSTSLDDPVEIADEAASVRFDLRFYLTESEWEEATNLLHPIIGNTYSRPWVRLLSGVGAAWIIMMPTLLGGQSWHEMLLYQPMRAAFLGLMALACALGTTRFAMKFLDHRLNRLDLDRHVMVSERGVMIAWNGRVFNYEWKDFVYFRESASVVILRNPGARFWTIPVRALPPGSETRFREFLRSKLSRRQPYSWSPDSSGYPH